MRLLFILVFLTAWAFVFPPPKAPEAPSRPVPVVAYCPLQGAGQWVPCSYTYRFYPA